MNFVCYRHPERIAVAKIERMMCQHTPEGEKEIKVRSPVCKQCAEAAQLIGTPIFELTEK
jgi:hypothetical protein